MNIFWLHKKRGVLLVCEIFMFVSQVGVCLERPSKDTRRKCLKRFLMAGVGLLTCGLPDMVCWEIKRSRSCGRWGIRRQSGRYAR